MNQCKGPKVDLLPSLVNIKQLTQLIVEFNSSLRQKLGTFGKPTNFYSKSASVCFPLQNHLSSVCLIPSVRSLATFSLCGLGNPDKQTIFQYGQIGINGSLCYDNAKRGIKLNFFQKHNSATFILMFFERLTVTGSAQKVLRMNVPFFLKKYGFSRNPKVGTKEEYIFVSECQTNYKLQMLFLLYKTFGLIVISLYLNAQPRPQKLIE